MKNGCAWLILYAVAIVQAALLGGLTASTVVYNYDATHRPRMSQQSYQVALHGWEVAAAICCAIPGVCLIGWYQIRSSGKNRQALSGQRNSQEDDTIWPPPPQE